MPPTLPDRPLPEPYRQKDHALSLVIFAFAVAVVSCAFYAATTHVDATLKKGMVLPAPACGWHATLVCDDVPGVECQWDRRWKCGYGVPWPNVVIRRPLTEEILKERYP